MDLLTTESTEDTEGTEKEVVRIRIRKPLPSGSVTSIRPLCPLYWTSSLPLACLMGDMRDCGRDG
jgi:hypothetical protein